MHKCSLFSPPAPSFIICRLSDDGRSDQCKVIPHCGFDLLSLIISDVVHLCMSLLPICLLWKNIYLGLLLTFFLGFLFLFISFSLEYHEGEEEKEVVKGFGGGGRGCQLMLLALKKIS